MFNEALYPYFVGMSRIDNKQLFLLLWIKLKKETAMDHKDIRIPFEVDGRRYEAVGFLNKDEQLVSGEDMLSRTANPSCNIIGEDDAVFIDERLNLLPENLRKFHLVTNQRRPDSPRNIMIFCCHDGMWRKFWSHLDCAWREDELVVRRLPQTSKEGSMSPKTKDEMIVEIRKWLDNIPNPDEPFVGAGNKVYSPRQMLQEIEAGTEFGEKLLAAALKLSSSREDKDPPTGDGK